MVNIGLENPMQKKSAWIQLGTKNELAKKEEKIIVIRTITCKNNTTQEDDDDDLMLQFPLSFDPL